MMSSFLHSWGLALGQLVVQVTLWLALGTAVAALAARRGPRAAAEAVTGVLAGVLLLTALSLVPWSGWYWATGPAPEWAQPISLAEHPPEAALLVIARPEVGGPSSVPAAVDATVPESPPPGGVPETAPAVDPWWPSALALVLPVAASVCLARLAMGLWAVRACRRRGRPVADQELLSLCDELRRTLGVNRQVELRELAGLGTPATVGWHRPLILLPCDWREWDEAERRSVLAHELAHVRRGDYAGWLAARLGAALHGYHPLVHWLAGRLRRHQELAADALAAPLAGGTNAYVRALGRLALRRDDHIKLGLARTFLPAHLSLTRRVQMLLVRRNTSEKAVRPACRLGLGVVLLLTCLAVSGLRRPAAAVAAEPEVVPPGARLVQRTYAVGDLLGTPDCPIEVRGVREGLIRLLTTSVAPESWQAGGGRGTVEYYPLGKALVINQTAEAHEQIARLLQSVRQTVGTQVAVEMRLVAVSEAMARRLARDVRLALDKPAGPALLSDVQLFQLMEALQGDRVTSILQAPKLTMFHLQEAMLQLEEKQIFVTGVEVVSNGKGMVFVPKNEAVPLGTRMTLLPVVEADRKAVRLDVRFRQRALESAAVPVVPVTSILPPADDDKNGQPRRVEQLVQQPKVRSVEVERTLTIPDNSTALLSVGQGPPVAPGPKGGKPESQHLFLFLTSRILSEPAEEAAVKARPVPTAAPAASTRAAPLARTAYVIEPPDVLLIESTQKLAQLPGRGEYLVRPDGTISLGAHGTVKVAGLTVAQAKEAVAAALNAKADEGINVVVLASNSKCYYVIVEGKGGEEVHRFSLTGNETVLDGVAQVNGLPETMAKKRVWVARGRESGGRAETLPVDWNAIVRDGETITNYQLLPGDRVYVKAIGPEPQGPEYQRRLRDLEDQLETLRKEMEALRQANRPAPAASPRPR